MSDIVAELDRWLMVFPAEEVPNTIGREQVQRARDEIVALRERYETNTRRRDIGAHVLDGKLFFRLKDGSTITCECIREPYASQVVEALAAAIRNQGGAP